MFDYMIYHHQNVNMCSPSFVMIDRREKRECAGGNSKSEVFV